jgi:alpha-glucan, water dikinase
MMKSFIETLRGEMEQGMISYEHVYHFDNGCQLAVVVGKNGDQYHVVLNTDLAGPLILHWGVADRFRYEWFLPPSSIYPEGTTIFQDKAAQTPFVDQAGFRRLEITISKQDAPLGISFVLKHADTDRWLKDDGRNFYIPIAVPPEREVSFGSAALASLANEIIEKEVSRNSWSLMHRFNLCYDLLDEIKKNDMDGLALIFVWLRFSAIRQLDWQRNYNTTPRELGHAMDRLTLKLADRYANEQERDLIRLILTTLGRGSNAQRVRDEILNIMHRHRIKEVSGHFMEEWHQKLHNNATPDDIVICEAYLEFLRSDGSLDRFYKRLEGGGVTRKRLESYERPIKSSPDFIPHLKEALIQDFDHFLRILREVHSGTDIGTAIDSARYLLDAETHSLMDFIWSHRDDEKIPVCTLGEKITESRRRLAEQFRGDQKRVRDLLFLDIALEDFLRTAVERNLDSHLSGNQMVELTAMVLENLCLSYCDEEFMRCLKHWESVKEMPHLEKEWPLLAKAVLDRLGLALGLFIDRYSKLFQPKAEFLGGAFHADQWNVTLFSEEVLRGRPAFVLSKLLRLLDSMLRKSAHLGNWQVISRGHSVGELQVVETLKSVQGKSFARPAVVVADSIDGDEEIPGAVTAIITSALIDSLSHLAIRARNAGLLFAVCYDPEIIMRLKSFRGHLLKLIVNATGEIVFEESREEIGFAQPRTLPVRAAIVRPVFTAYAVSVSDFNEKNVGYKSNNLSRIHGKLPEWINFPASVALPFGVFERVLAAENNREIARHCEELVRRIDDAGKERGEVLAELRKTVLNLKAPDELVSALHEVMEKAGLAWPSKDGDEVWMCIKRVWSSKWNERAYLSRRANGIPHEDLSMSVLIQRIVEADYSFVIHTVNPFTSVKEEIYAEVVLGLGETLSGSYPGKALSFTCGKAGQDPQLLSFPSKSIGLFGGGTIFRSDSNGEDLAGYAGAGLYDSFMLPQPRRVRLDYTGDPLVRDPHFRKDFLVAIANIGAAIEKFMKFPQDIEGAYSDGQYYVVQTRPQVGI